MSRNKAMSHIMIVFFLLLSIVIISVDSFVTLQRRRNSSLNLVFVSKESILDDVGGSEGGIVTSNNNDSYSSSILPWCFNVDELGDILDGKGRARLVWDYLRRGEDPLLLSNNGLGKKVQLKLQQAFPTNGDTIESRICQVEQVTKTSLSTKLLIRYLHDNALVETVIIPMNNDDNDSTTLENGKNKKKKRPYSTLCVSSQVGCRQACTFCDTGRMGKLRSLTTNEILAQLYLAQKYNHNDDSSSDIENIVFMGMGEPADNVEAVTQAVRIMTGQNEFQIAPKHVTISTVGISPDSFSDLVQNTNATLAWSVHASDDTLRRQLVPTTRYTMTELRDGLIQALVKYQSSRSMRRVLLEVTLIQNVNDRITDAKHLANFVTEFQQLAPPKTKLVVNLIPYNPSATGNIVVGGIPYETSPPSSVHAFQQTLSNHGIRTFVRTTRGDDDSAACGQLATKKLMMMEKKNN